MNIVGINNNYVIVKHAVIDFFVNGTPVEDTINASQDIHDFQIIAKAGGGYQSVYRVPSDYESYRKRYERENPWIDPFTGKKKKPRWRWSCYNGPRSEVQRVNRVYAAKDPGMGTLVKVKPDGTVGKIGGLPESCMIDNKNTLTLDAVDREWYVALAKKYIEDYINESK